MIKRAKKPRSKKCAAKSLADLAAHFKKRALERYGLVINKERYRELNEWIKKGKGRFVGQESHTRTHWQLYIDGQWVYVVYNKAIGGLVTALPPEALPTDDGTQDNPVRVRAFDASDAEIKAVRRKKADEFILSLRREYGFDMSYDEYEELHRGMPAINGVYLGRENASNARWMITAKDRRICVIVKSATGRIDRAIQPDDSFFC